MINTFEKTIIPAIDRERLEALRSYKIVYSQNEEFFNNIVRLMAEDFQTPVASINFVEEEDVFVKASVGAEGMQQFDREVSFCSLAVLSDEPTVIENAEKDPAFVTNPLVQGEFGLRFYAAAPLITREGFRIGAVCIVDKKGRRFNDEARQQLLRFSSLVMHELELKAEIKRKQNELAEKELRLKEAYKLARIGSWEYDVLSGEAAWSDELFEIYRINKRSEIKDLNAVYLSMVHPDDLDKVMYNYRHPEKVPASLIIRFVLPDGEQIYLNQLRNNVYDKDGRLLKITGISQDITERMRHEEEVRFNQERFKRLVVNSSDIICVIDEAANYTYISESVEHILGYSSAYFQNRNAFEFIHPEDQQTVLSYLSKIYDNKHVEIPSFRFRNGKGEWRWLESKVANLLDDPVINGLVVNSRDITEHKKAEEALVLSERKFKALVHNSSDIIVMLDAEGTFTYISENAKIFLGYEQEELLNKNAFHFVHQDDVTNVVNEFGKVLSNDETAHGVSHRFLTKGGRWVWFESKGINHLSDTVINGVIINAREIDDRIRLQQKLDEELATRQLMITKAAITAQEKERSQVGLELHDNVNQVLTTVKLYQELCLSGIDNRDQLIRKSVDLLQSSINEIRSLSKRLSAPTLGKIKLHDSVKELLDAVAATGKIKIQFHAVKMAHLEVEPELHLGLYRILQEHLTNVLKHANASVVEVKLTCKDRFLTLQVTDDGVGFDITRKSSGIGITNMRTRAESLGGTFVMISKPGCGAALVVKFSTNLYGGQSSNVSHSGVDE